MLSERGLWLYLLGASLLLILALAGWPAAHLEAVQLPIGAAVPERARPQYLDWEIGFVEQTKAFREMGDHSLALDADGHPHIAYGDDELYYARYDGQRWQVKTVDAASADQGEYTSIAVDQDGHVHISYYDRWNGNLKYAYYDGSLWRIEVVDWGMGSC